MSEQTRRFRIPPVVAIPAVIICLGVSVWLVVRTMRTQPVPGMTEQVLLKCVACEHEFTTSMQWVYDNWVSEDDVLMTPGSVCPKCQKKALAFAWKCPKDGTIFFRNLEARANGKVLGKFVPTQYSQKCPKCQWTGADGAK